MAIVQADAPKVFWAGRERSRQHLLSGQVLQHFRDHKTLILRQQFAKAGLVCRFFQVIRLFLELGLGILQDGVEHHAIRRRDRAIERGAL